MVGAGGAGASAAALLAHYAGAVVSACDAGGPSPYTAALEVEGVPLASSHDAAHVGRGGQIAVDRLAVTKALTAVDPGNPELAAARAAGIPLEPWQQLIADAAATSRARLVAIAGTHGKSTTTGWLLHVLVAAGRDPSGFVGALLPPSVTGGLPSTARWGSGDTFVVEADEYAGNFDAYRPSLAVLLNAEWDHPDVFADEADVVATFARWISASGGRGSAARGTAATLVANAGNRGVAEVLETLREWSGNLALFLAQGSGTPPATPFASSLGPASVTTGRVLAAAPEGTMLELVFPAGGRLEVMLALPGWQYVEDALAVAVAARELGVESRAIVAGLESFRGVGRRLEVRGEFAGVAVIDDYGHHPTAISATITAVKQRYPGRRLWAVYEPLTYHRTAAMLDGFAEVLAEADEVVVADIWPGRDRDTTVTSASALAHAVTSRGGPRAGAWGSVEETAERLAVRVRPGDVVLVMGGGRSYVIADRLVAALRSKAAEAG